MILAARREEEAKLYPICLRHLFAKRSQKGLVSLTTIDECRFRLRDIKKGVVFLIVTTLFAIQMLKQ